ncbi:large ribosomal subunit protein mL46 [Centruroides vittatus]|uniref:large ribosomal subunit protein mL46 n=1 Tax=Centruroides vittatus TaxID=120091 RepID=UPI00350FFE77
MASCVFRLLINRSFNGQCLRKACTAASPMVQTPPASHHQWHIMSAICLERKPVVSQEMTPTEASFSNLIQKIEHENSLLSDHELRHIEDAKYAEKIKKSEDDIDLDAATKQTAQEFEDVSSEELQKFKAAPIITEADKKNCQHSLNRKLRNSLLLIIKQKLGNDYRWLLPQSVRREDENLRETAERIVKEMCQDKLQITMMGNAPAGHYKYKYPKAERNHGILGAKVFFFKAQVRKGEITKEELLQQNPNVKDYCWATRSELKEKLHPDYLKAVQSFLIDEN